MSMLTQLKNTFSRSRMSMSTSAPKTIAKPKMKTAVKSKVKAVAVKAKLSRAKKTALVSAEGEQCFWSNDGKILSTLLDLKIALGDMSAESYNHHTDGRNDFANWVESVLQDKECASGLRKAKNQKAAYLCVTTRLSQ